MGAAPAVVACLRGVHDMLPRCAAEASTEHDEQQCSVDDSDESICDISGKRANNANRVTFSNKHFARWQYPNLQTKRLYSKELDRYVRVKVATSTLRDP